MPSQRHQSYQGEDTTEKGDQEATKNRKLVVYVGGREFEGVGEIGQIKKRWRGRGIRKR